LVWKWSSFRYDFIAAIYKSFFIAENNVEKSIKSFSTLPTMNTRDTAKGSALQVRRKKPVVQAGHV
jgi:hypothetical protein